MLLELRRLEALCPLLMAVLLSIAWRPQAKSKCLLLTRAHPSRSSMVFPAILKSQDHLIDTQNPFESL